MPDNNPISHLPFYTHTHTHIYTHTHTYIYIHTHTPAAYIRNPEYEGASSGPEIVFVGHNPFRVNLDLSTNIVLTAMSGEGSSHHQATHSRHHPSRTHTSRRKFTDEYIMDRWVS